MTNYSGNEQVGLDCQSSSTPGRDKSRLLAMLRAVPVFGGIEDGALRRLLDQGAWISVSKGGCFFRENDPARSMFVLVTGAAVVVKSFENGEYELFRLEPGDCFGELELIDFCPRAASVRAEEDCRAVEISAALLHNVFKNDETNFAMFQMNMGREVSRRLRKLDAELAGLRGGAGARALDEPPEQPGAGGSAAPAMREFLRCNVCTKRLMPDEEHLEVWHETGKFIFCCPLCAEHFRKNPDVYVASGAEGGNSVSP